MYTVSTLVALMFITVFLCLLRVCSLCTVYCSLSSGVLQSSQEREGGGIPVSEVRGIFFPPPLALPFSVSLAFVRHDKQSGGRQ